MAFVQFSKVSLAFGDRKILSDVSVNLARGTKAALTGANGSGKTTLIRVLAGLLEADSGERAVQKGTRISYLPQSGIVHSGCTLREEADRAFAFGYEIEKEITHVAEVLATNPTNAPQLLEVYQDLTDRLEESGWARRDTRSQQVLLGLGFSVSDFGRSVGEFSGGWQMRIALAKVLLENPDILLLDEPTNYLDIEALTWLEQFLADFTGGFLLVSHDRYFLDMTVSEVYELFNGELRRYKGNYTHYEQVREVELESLVARYNEQQDEIRKLEDFIRRFGYKATKAAQAQERQKMLDKIQRIEIPETLKHIHFTFPPAPHSGRLVCTLEDVSKTYDGTTYILRDLNLVIEKGERLVVSGRNGAGKTTLLRILAIEDASFTGRIKYGAGVEAGYFSQDSAEQLSGDDMLLDLIERDAPLALVPKARDMLGAFLFRNDDVFKPVSVLSGGEKSRIALLKLLLRPLNLLILDEPTNHLDMHSKDVLLDALKNFEGTVVFVSHDKGFIDTLATRTLELTPDDEGNRQVRVFEVKHSEQQEKKADWEEERRKRSEQRAREREAERLLGEITDAEAHKKELEAELARPTNYSDPGKSAALHRKITDAEVTIAALMEAWEKTQGKIELFGCRKL